MESDTDRIEPTTYAFSLNIAACYANGTRYRREIEKRGYDSSSETVVAAVASTRHLIAAWRETANDVLEKYEIACACQATYEDGSAVGRLGGGRTLAYDTDAAAILGVRKRMDSLLKRLC